MSEEIQPEGGEVLPPETVPAIDPATLALQMNSDEIDLDEVEAAKVEVVPEEAPATDPVSSEDTAEGEEPTPVVVMPELAQEDNQGAVDKVVMTEKTVEQHSTVIAPSGRGALEELNLPPENQTVVENKLNAAGNIGLTGTTAQFSWGVSLRDALTYTVLGTHYQDRLADKDAGWSQNLNYKGTEIKASAPSMKQKPGTNVIEGETALLKLITHMGVGALVKVPLFNSGIWVYFKPATDLEFLNLNVMLGQDKTALGRGSWGLAHSNNIVFSASRVFEFALQHVYATSVKNEELPIANLARYIKPQDLHTFIWGFLYACYPSGYKYKTPCINDPEKCQHVFEGVLNMGKLQVVDTRAMTDSMKNFMSAHSSNNRSLDQVLKYQEEVTRMHARRFVINEGTNHEIAFTIKTPTMSEWFEQGFRYINGIVDSVAEAMEKDAGTDARNVFMNESSNATKLGQYVHFIDQIEFGQLTSDGGSVYVVKDAESVLAALKSLSGTDSIRERIIQEILKYVGDSTLSIPGIPAFDCPVCKKPQEDSSKDLYPRLSAWIPLDMLQVFFGLLGQRINRIENRN